MKIAAGANHSLALTCNSQVMRHIFFCFLLVMIISVFVACMLLLREKITREQIIREMIGGKL